MVWTIISGRDAKTLLTDQKIRILCTLRWWDKNILRFSLALVRYMSHLVKLSLPNIYFYCHQCNTEDLLIFRLESSSVPFFFHSSCWFIKVNNLFTLSLSHLFQILVSKVFPYKSITLNNSFSNIIISSQRLVIMSASLCTQTVLRCLIIQVLNIKSLLPKCLTHFLHSNLEHGLAILTESFSPLRSVLHNLSCWSPKQQCALSYAIPFYIMYT